MTYRAPIPYVQGDRRPTCNVEQARLYMCPEHPPSRQHIYNLYHREDIQGYFLGSGRGLRLYIDSIEDYKRRSGEQV